MKHCNKLRPMHILWLYRLLWIGLLPIVIVLMLWRALTGKESRARLKERLGFPSHARPEGPLIWLHGASVGESLSILPLIEHILAERADVHILVTTGTRTSARLMGKRLPELAGGMRVFHQYAPLDFYPCVQRFYRHWAPTLTAFLESEFWPELISTAQPILLNARISDRSFPRYRKYRWFFEPLLRCIPQAFAQREEDARRLRAMGVPEATAAGNLKFDASPLKCDETELSHLQTQLQERPVIVAASTHPGEEEQIAELHTELSKEIANLLTIIVPRHPQRGGDIARKLNAPRRSQTPTIPAETDLYIADTLGEMGLWYRLANLVIIGGSLVPHGGHNPLESLKLGTITLSGPYMFNFKDMLPGLVGQNLLLTTTDLHELTTQAHEFLQDTLKYTEQKEHIASTMPALSGATEKTADMLLNLLLEREAF